MSVGIKYVLVGPRDLSHLERSISIVRSYAPRIDIEVYHDYNFRSSVISSLNIRTKKFERIGYPNREENRNNRLWTNWMEKSKSTKKKRDFRLFRY